MSWKDKLSIGALALALMVLVVLYSTIDKHWKPASVVGNTEIQKYDDDTVVCYLIVNKKTGDASAISCLRK